MCRKKSTHIIQFLKAMKANSERGLVYLEAADLEGVELEAVDLEAIDLEVAALEGKEEKRRLYLNVKMKLHILITSHSLIRKSDFLLSM